MRAHRDMIVTQKILLGGSAKLRWASVVQWKEKTLEVDGASSIYFIYFFGCRIRNSEAATSGGGAQRPVWRVNEPEKTGARSARARTRGQNPLVHYMSFRNLPCCIYTRTHVRVLS
jgi:hypothetical protein